MLWLVVLFSTIPAFAAYTPATVPNPKLLGQEHYVANPDQVIDADDEAFLNHCAASLDTKTQVEMCVVALKSINNADAFYFAYELFQRWGIGRVNKNTGVLVLFVLDSHDIRIMTGTGIEGVLTDARCSEIVRKDMTPMFREGDYGGGLCRGALRIYETCTKGNAPEELLNMKSVTNRGGFAEEDDNEEAIAWVSFIILLTVLIVFICFVWKIGGPHSGGRSGGYSGGGHYYGGGYSGGYSGGFSGGGSWGGGSTFGGGAGGKW